MRRSRASRKSVSCSVFPTIVHAFIFSHIDYCNALYVGLPKPRFSSHRSVLNSAVRLISRLPGLSHISTLMTGVLLWLPVTYHVQYTVLLLFCRVQHGKFPKYRFDLMRKPLSVLSYSLLRSANRVHRLSPRL